MLHCHPPRNQTFKPLRAASPLIGCWLIGLLLSLGACDVAQSTGIRAVTITPTTAATQPSDNQSTPPTVTATLEITAPTPETITLDIWLPERLFPANDATALEILSGQVDEFTSNRPNTLINLRRKRYYDIGGVISTLRSASVVAPGALPDLTFVRRRDLLTIQQIDLIQPFEGRVSSGIVADLYNSALRLGQINDQLYGLAYTLDMMVMAANPRANLVDSRLETLLASPLNFAFPAQNTSGISEVFLLQYLAAGGTFSPEGELTLNEAALLETLQFYEQGLESGLIDTRVLNYTLPSDYEALLIDGVWDAGIIYSDSLYTFHTIGFQPQIHPIPTRNGNPITLLDGWMWVIVAKDTERQVIASEFVNWMMNPRRQGVYTQALQVVPSQAKAATNYPLADLPPTLLNGLIENAVLPVTETNTNTVVRALQTALIAVISDEASAEAATRNAANQLSG